MRYSKLTKEEIETLTEGYRNHPKFHVRQRFHAILLSNEDWQVKEIAAMLKIRARTLYSWMNRWQDMGLVGLTILPGRGLKARLSPQDQTTVEVVKKKY